MSLSHFYGFVPAIAMLMPSGGCHSREGVPLPLVATASAQATAFPAAQPWQAISFPHDGGGECPTKHMASASVSAGTGRPQATAAYPDNWRLSRSAEGRMELWVEPHVSGHQDPREVGETRGTVPGAIHR
jgi:hypothetical protein